MSLFAQQKVIQEKLNLIEEELEKLDKNEKHKKNK